MPLKPSDSYRKDFVTSSPTTGAATNADSLPTATADWIGSGTGSMALTVTNIDAGRYSITGTVPAGRLKGDTLNVSVAATVGSVAGKAVVDTQVLDSKRVGDLNDLGGTAQTGDNYALANGTSGFVAIKGNTAAIVAKLPTNNIADETLVIAATSSILAAVGTPAQSSQIPANFTTGLFASAGVFATAALANAPTGGSAPTVAQIRAEMDANSTKLANITGAVALASQIPANFTTATFSSAGVFSTGALQNAPTGSGGSGGASLLQIQTELDTRGLTSAMTTTITTNLNATVGSRSTYAGGDTSGTTTLLSRVPTFPTNFSALAITASTGLVSVNYAQTGLTPRALDSVADSALTHGDALVAAICAAAGKEAIVGTAYTVKTPSTGTTIKSFLLDSGTAPTSRT